MSYCLKNGTSPLSKQNFKKWSCLDQLGFTVLIFLGAQINYAWGQFLVNDLKLYNLYMLSKERCKLEMKVKPHLQCWYASLFAIFRKIPSGGQPGDSQNWAQTGDQGYGKEIQTVHHSLRLGRHGLMGMPACTHGWQQVWFCSCHLQSECLGKMP